MFKNYLKLTLRNFRKHKTLPVEGFREAAPASELGGLAVGLFRRRQVAGKFRLPHRLIRLDFSRRRSLERGHRPANNQPACDQICLGESGGGRAV